MGLQADPGRNWATRVVWTRSMFMKGEHALVAGRKLELSQLFSPLLERAA